MSISGEFFEGRLKGCVDEIELTALLSEKEKLLVKMGFADGMKACNDWHKVVNKVFKEEVSS